MKGLFKSKPRTPTELVRYARELLIFLNHNFEARGTKFDDKMNEVCKTILEIRRILFGNGESDPNPEACAQLTQELFKEDTFRLVIVFLPKLDIGKRAMQARQNATHVIANLQRQRVNSRLIASEYLANNIDIMDVLIHGYEDNDIALTYGAIARECIRHQTVARYVLESEHMKKFFDYIQFPNFEISSDAASTFRELLTRHKSTVADFLTKNYNWFVAEYNSKLLESPSYITKRHAVKLLADMLLDRSNAAVMVRYVSSLDHMRILMNLLRDSNKTIQLESFHVFKLFVANQNKPPEILNVLLLNRSKLLRFLQDFKLDKEDNQFDADKAQVMREICVLEPQDRPNNLQDCDLPC